MDANNDKKALDFAFRCLGNREHSRREVIVKLERKQFEPEVIERTLRKLVELGQLDDRSFAANYIRSRSKKKPSGYYKLKYELLQKGISEETIREVLEDYDNSTHCLNAAMKKLPLLKGDDRCRKNKMHRFLLNRGFDNHTIRETIDRIFSS